MVRRTRRPMSITHTETSEKTQKYSSLTHFVARDWLRGLSWIGSFVLYSGLEEDIIHMGDIIAQAIFFVPSIVTSPSKFAVPYTLGNILALAA